MPALCGSTTFSASIVAIAASVALLPALRISVPAAAARIGALTSPWAEAAAKERREGRAAGTASSSGKP